MKMLKNLMKNKGLLVIMALVVVAILLVSSAVLFELVYPPSVNPDTTTDNYRKWIILSICYFCNNGSVLQTGGANNADGELMDVTYMTSWYDNGDSVDFNLQGVWRPCFIDCVPTFTKYHWEITMTENGQEIPLAYMAENGSGYYDTTRVWVGDPDAFNPKPFNNVVNPFGGEQTHPFTGRNEQNVDQTVNTVWYNLPQQDWNPHGETEEERYCQVEVTTQLLHFRLKGPHTATLRAALIVDNMWWTNGFPGDNHMYNDLLIAVDECNLRSGDGTIQVVPNQLPPYGRHFEEGQTITFDVWTEWAGHSSDGKGWLIQLKDSSGLPYNGAVMHDDAGTPYTTGTVGGREGAFFVPNDLGPGYGIHWVIPEGLYNPPGSGEGNTWVIVLSNLLTGIDADDFCVLFEGASQYCPGAATLTIVNAPADHKWHEGDQPILHMEANRNPDLQPGEEYYGIQEFEVKAYYGSILNMLDNYLVPATFQGGLLYIADDSYLEIDQDTEDLQIEVTPWSPPGRDDGGLPGLPDSTTLDIQQEGEQGGTIQVYVLGDGSPVYNARVLLKSTSGTLINDQLTDSSGYIGFPGMPNGRYKIEATHPDYFMGGSAVCFVSDDSPQVEIVLQSTLFYIELMMCAVILIVFILVAVFLPVIVPVKIIILVIGIVLFTILLLYFLGFLSILGI